MLSILNTFRSHCQKAGRFCESVTDKITYKPSLVKYQTVDVSSHNRVYTIPVFEDANAMYMRNSLGNRQCMLFAQSRGGAINANGNECIRKAV